MFSNSNRTTNTGNSTPAPDVEKTPEDFTSEVNQTLRTLRSLAESLKIQFKDVEKAINEFNMENSEEVEENADANHTRLTKLSELQKGLTYLNSIKFELEKTIESKKSKLLEMYDLHETEPESIDSDIEETTKKYERYMKEGKTKLAESQKLKLDGYKEIKKLEESVNSIKNVLDNIQSGTSETLVFIKTKEELDAEIKQLEIRKSVLLDSLAIDEDILEEEYENNKKKAHTGSEKQKKTALANLATLDEIKKLIEQLNLSKREIEKFIVHDLIQQRDALMTENELSTIDEVKKRKCEVLEDLQTTRPNRTNKIKQLNNELEVLNQILEIDERTRQLNFEQELISLPDHNHPPSDPEPITYSEPILDPNPNNLSETNLVDQEPLSDLISTLPNIEQTKEDILNFYYDYIKTPFSVEKILIRFILFLLVNKSSEKLRKHISQTNPEVMKLVENFPSESDLKEFEDKLIEEKIIEIKEYKLLLQDLRSAVTNKLDIFPKKISEASISTLNSLRVIDVEYTKRLVNKNNLATDSIRGRDIKVPIAPSGTGKSTFIQVVAGSKMGRVVNEKGELLEYYEAKEITNPYLREVRSGHSMKSETSTIIPVMINLKELNVPKGGEVMIVDVPGMDDSRGVEIDLSNALAIVNTLSEAKSIQFIFLFSARSIGNNLEGLTKSAKYIVNMFDFESSNEEVDRIYNTFTYLFTRYAPGTNPMFIRDEIVNKYENMNEGERSNIPFMQLIENIKEQTEEKGATIVYPNNREEIVPLWKMINRKTPLKNPKEFLKYNVTDDSRMKINSFLRIRSESINKAMHRNDFEMIKFDLDRMQYIYEITQFEIVQREINSCLDNIKQHFDINYKTTSDMFVKALDLNNKLTLQDMLELRRGIEFAEKSNCIRTTYLESKVASLRHYEMILEDGVNKLFLNLGSSSVEDEKFMKSLMKLNTIKNSESKFVEKYSEVEKKVKDYINDNIQDLEKLLSEGRYLECDKNKNKVARVIGSVSEYIDLSEINRSNYEMNLRVKQYIDSLISFKKTIVETCKNKNIFTLEDVKQLNLNEEKVLRIFEAEFASSLYDTECLKGVKTEITQLNDDQLAIFDKKQSELYEILKGFSKNQSQGHSSIETIEPLYKQLQVLITIKTVEKERFKNFLEVKQSITTVVLNFQLTVNEIIKTIFSEFNQEDVNALLAFIRMLKNSEWLNDVCEGICSDRLTTIKDNVRKNIEKTKCIIDRSNLVLQKQDDLLKIFTQIKIMRSLAEIGSEVETEFNQLMTSFINNVTSLIEEIKKDSKDEEHSNKKIDFIKFEEYLKFNDVIQKIERSSLPDEFPIEETDSGMNRLSDKLTNYFNSLLNNLKNKLSQFSNLNNQSDTEDIETARDYINEINRVKSPNFEKCRKYLLEKISDKELRISFEQLWRDLNDNFLNSFQANNLVNCRILLEKVRRLIIFDDEPFLDRKFSLLYETYNKQYYENIPNTLISIYEHIDNCRFRDIINSLDQLRNAGDVASKKNFDDCLMRLDTKAQGLFESLTGLSRTTSTKLEFEVVERCDKIIRDMKLIKVELKSFIDDSLKDRINDCINTTVRTINRNIKKKLEDISTVINNNNLTNADKRIIEINNICQNFFVNYCDQENFDMIIKLQKNIENQLESIYKKYSTLRTSEYYLDKPKETIEKLRDDNSESNRYINFTVRLNRLITEKFREEISIVMKEVHNTKREGHLKSLRNNLKFVPEEIRHTVEESIESSLNNLQIERDSMKDDIQINIQNLNYQKLADLYKDCTDLQNNDGSSLIKSFITTKAYELKNEIMLNFEDVNKISLTIQKIKSLEEINEKFSSITSNLVIELFTHLKLEMNGLITSFKSFFETESVMERANENRLHNITNVLNMNLNDSLPTINDDIYSDGSDRITLSVYRKHFVYISEFLLHLRKHEKKIYLRIFSNDMDDRLNKLMKGGKEAILKLNTMMRKNFSGLCPDIIIISNLLSKFKAWGSVFSLFNKNEEIKALFTNSDLEHVNQFKETVTNNGYKYQTYLALVTQKLEEIRQDVLNKNLKDDSTRLKETREKFFCELQKEVETIDKMTELNEYIDKNTLEAIKCECKSVLIKKVQDLVVESNKILANPLIEAQEFAKFNLVYENLFSLSNVLPAINCVDERYSGDTSQILQINIQEEKNNLETKLEAVVNNLKTQIETENQAEKISEKLISVQTIVDEVPKFSEKSRKVISDSLTRIKSQSNGARNISILASCIEKNPIGQNLITEQPMLDGMKNGGLIIKTKSQDINYVLDEDDLTKEKRLTGNDIDYTKLRDKYNIVMDTYTKVLNRFLKEIVDYSSILAELKTKLPKITQKKNNIRFSGQNTDEIPEVMGYIFAIWTLQNSKNYFDLNAQSDPNGAVYLKTPLPAQIISCLRILCLDEKKVTLKNNLVQIGTGEGKSITLAVTCCILALYGFKVSCACYSKMLSDRDYEEFLPLFQLLGLTSKISYGTFNQLCEEILNSKINIRKKTEAAINGTKILESDIMADDSANVLIVDEFDVLFSDSFYGQEYIPCVSLKNQLIFDFFEKLWKERKSPLNETLIKLFPEYLAVKESLGKYDFLIDDILYSIEVDLKSFESVSYVVKDNQIGYSFLGELAFNINHGYKTLFAYFHEFELNNITRDALEANVSIPVLCGRFSYSELPREFNFILGVTGTLKSLSETEKRVIENDYNIRKFTYTPSVFGKNNLRFDPRLDVYIENSPDYYDRIEKEIRAKLRGNNQGTRCILVFWENKKALMEFYNSPYMQEYRSMTNIISDDLTVEEKRQLVKKATNPGTITFLLPSLGRGTDFRIRDPDLSSNGGIHLIATFFPKLLAEEIQTKGRVARQGDQGSCSFVILDTSLEVFNITLNDLNNEPNKYEYINKKRNEIYEYKYQCNVKLIAGLKNMHRLSMEFSLHLEKNDFASIKKFLKSLNKGQSQTNIRTIILLDATGSMSNPLQACKAMIVDMYEAILPILDKFNIDRNCFSLQFSAYRNYNSSLDDILFSSPWLQEPGKLREFMEKVPPSGGWGNEAIEVALNHVKSQHSNETPVNQVILIGDAAPNTREDITKKRSESRSEKWAESKYNHVQYYEDELIDIINNQIPIHSMYINSAAKTSFEGISNVTRGKSIFLDMKSPQATKVLLDFVTEEILRKISEREGLQDALVQEYRAKVTFN